MNYDTSYSVESFAIAHHRVLELTAGRINLGSLHAQQPCVSSPLLGRPR